MHSRSWTHAIAGAAALVVLAGCSSSSDTSLEQEPGELDYNVGVTRAAILHGIAPAGLEYNWWTNETIDPENDDATGEVTEDLIETGLTDYLCKSLTEPRDGFNADWYISMVAEEAVRGAVLSAASDEFREAYEVAFHAYTNYGEAPDEELQAYRDATDSLAGELNDEWVELYELQETLGEQAYSVEGAQAAQAAAAERCDVDSDDYEVIDEPVQRVNVPLLQMPAPSQAGSED